jgi:two-component system, NtrC family, response regulator GlrR
MTVPKDPQAQTRVLDAQGRATALIRSQIRLTVERGTDAGKVFDLERGFIRIGTGPDNEVVLSDDAVSSRHAELELGEEGFLVRDLGSTNGTTLGGHRIREAYLKSGARIGLGETTLLFQPQGTFRVPLSEGKNQGPIIGQSLALREVLGQLERYAPGDQPVLILGETGTGKDLFARCLHEQSPRNGGPFEVFECGSVQANLIEDELFGHVAGAFSGAVGPRPGVFERAHGGTLLLDEIGELPLELQPKLLRVLEEKKLRRLGDTRQVSVDVRICAATHRDLSVLVQRGKFRADLFFRLNVLRLELPPLRRRPEDIALLARTILQGRAELDETALAMMTAFPWPGNVRQLKNVLERAAAFAREGRIQAEDLLLTSQGDKGGIPQILVETHRSYHGAKEACLDAFERHYLVSVLERNSGNVSHSADEAQVPRQTLHRLMSKHNIKSGAGP